MSIDMNNDDVIPTNIPTAADACYEIVASQEEIYLEETEEELREILISEDPSAYAQPETAAVDCRVAVESLDEELGRAAEELITGDCDDPPLSKEAVAEMLSMSRSSSSRSR